jgi:hypothetical protein
VFSGCKECNKGLQGQNSLTTQLNEREEMVSWYWLIVAFIAGAFFGLAVIASFVLAGQAERGKEERRRSKVANLSSSASPASDD